ncbi:hypothetical protein FB562_2502 [Homoserinimonas aerilata]|uniref:Tfp pilus assembly protein PilN n=1 Tax=Homoserinimonas aerilata TaxID=1162970 RepID=A0A542Y1G1_9MICO|nr:hypothetical protein [Homoserinimonas aerilata]TQL41916.1 hypothetical protein FB562_2502 [Homoserinimonas aerilata]
MSAKDNAIVVGGEPRIDFLPPEIKQKKQARRTLRSLVMLVIAVAAVCLLGYAGVTTIAIASQARLSSEQDRTITLISEQGKYSQARSVAATVETARLAQLVASAPEIMWREYLGQLQATLPAGASITQIDVAGTSTTQGPPAVDGPLAKAQVTQIVLAGVFTSVSDVAQWQDNLEGIESIVGFWITPISDAEGAYEIQATINVDHTALALRLFEKAPDADAAAESEVAETTEGGN